MADSTPRLNVELDWSEELDNWGRRAAKEMLVATGGVFESEYPADDYLDVWVRRAFKPTIEGLEFPTDIDKLVALVLYLCISSWYQAAAIGKAAGRGTPQQFDLVFNEIQTSADSKPSP